MSTARDLRIGVDIGGTFTDLALIDAAGRLRTGKTLTTPDAPDDAVVAGVTALLTEAAAPAERVGLIAHATTLFTNALIERKGARTAQIATKGFRDAVAIGREHRFDMYDLRMERPEPLAPRDRRYEIDERILFDGSVRKALDPEEAAALAERLRKDGVEAVAICLMHAYANDAHERALAEILAARAPEITVTRSAALAPVIREYDRASTALANVYVQRLAERYLARLEARLRDEVGLSAPLLVMHSAGGLAAAAEAARHPIRFVQSGPAAGALAATRFGVPVEQAGAQAPAAPATPAAATGAPHDLLSFDMGGTTAKACLIREGRPLIAPDFEVDRRYRFQKGSGLPVKIPVIEMIEIGAGGGSIARVDGLGRLQVGPDSAGAVPGPACYGSGATAPTVTDADLLLGYLDADYFAGGAMRLDRAAAERAIAAAVAEPLGLSPLQAAWAIHRLANETMAEAARLHAVERGRDAAMARLCAFGGAGPVHAFGVAQSLRQREILFPRAAGALSAVGLLAAPMSADAAATRPQPLEDIDAAETERFLALLERQARAPLSGHVAPEAVRIERRAEMRYRRQGFEIVADLPDGAPDQAALRAAFETAYAALYGRTVSGAEIDVVAWRVTARGPEPPFGAPGVGAAAGVDAEKTAAAAALKGRRAIWLPGRNGGVDGAMTDAPVYHRDRLAPGAALAGPAIIEERDSTVVLAGPCRCAVRDDGALRVWLDRGAARAGRGATEDGA